MTKSEAPKVGSISNADVEKLLELESKATAGYWREHSSEMREGTIVTLDGKYVCSVGFDNWPQDADFISKSRNLIRPLCLDWLRLKEENENLRKQIECHEKISHSLFSIDDIFDEVDK